MTPEELQAVARKHGVDAEELRSLAPYYGAVLQPRSFGEALTQGARGTAGFVGQSALMGLPQFVYKKFQDEPMRAALDDIHSRAEEQTSLTSAPGRELSQFIMPGGAIGHSASAGVKGALAAGAATGAIYGVTGSREGEELRGAAIGGGLGAGLGLAGGLVARKLAGMASREAEAATPQLVKDGVASRAIDIEKGTDQILDRNRSMNEIRKEFILGGAESHPELMYRAEQALPEHVVSSTSPEQLKAVVGRDLQETAMDFASHISAEVEGGTVATMEKAADVIGKFEKQVGSGALEKTYSDWERFRGGQEYLRTNELKADPDVFGGLHRPFEIISGAQRIFQITDEKFGTNLYPDHLKYNEGKNRSTFAQEGAEKLAVAPTREMEKAKLDPQMIGKMLDGSEEITNEASGVVGKWRDAFNGVSDLLKKGDAGAGVPGLPIRFLEEYFPSQVPDVAEFVVRVNQKIREMEGWSQKNVGKSLAALSDAEIQALDAKNQEFSDFLRGLGWLDKNEIRTQGQLQNAMTQSRQPAVVREAQDLRAASPTFSREGKVPDWIREWDVRKVYSRYSNPSINYMYTRESFQKIRNQAKLLEQAGAKRQADYVNRWASNMISVPSRSMASGTAAIGNKIKIAALSAAEKTRPGSTEKAMFETLAATPDILTSISHNIYSNTLGTNPRAILRNLPQTILTTAPELGGPYGYNLALRGYVDAAANWSRLAADVDRLGLAPRRFTTENMDFLRRGIQQSAAYRMTDKGLEKISNATMYLYEKSDLVNRAATLSIGNRWAADLLEKNSSAVAALRRAPAGIQRNALALMTAGDGDGLRKLLASHLNANTQFNYNRASLSEFGRVMGPLFTTFTKWPSEIAGDVYRIYATKGVGRGSIQMAGKYMAPMAVLGGMQHLLFGPADEMTDREKKMIGSGGLVDWAPIASLGAIFKGDLMTPPAVDVATKIIRSAAADNADLHDVSHNAAAAVAQSFVPGMGLVRFLTDDMATYLTGRRPDGNFLERTGEGFNQLTR